MSVGVSVGVIVGVGVGVGMGVSVGVGLGECVRVHVFMCAAIIFSRNVSFPCIDLLPPNITKHTLTHTHTHVRTASFS